ncbi:MAG: hypothetical protein ACE5GA_10880 [Candidatus Zixiibacteriota bacterium]
MKKPAPVLCLLSLSLAITLQACSQGGESSDTGGAVTNTEARAVYEASQADMKANGLGALATHMHPTALADFKNSLVPLFSQMAADPAGAQSPLFETYRNRDSALNFQEMDPAVFFQGFTDMLDSQMPDFGKALAERDVQVLGEVDEGDSLVHLLTRNTMTMAGQIDQRLTIVTLINSGDGWKMGLSNEIDGMAGALRQQFMRR